MTDASLSEDEIKDYVKDNLARYKVPREVVFVDELPRNATGKVLKRELAEQAGGTEDGGEQDHPRVGRGGDRGRGEAAETADTTGQLGQLTSLSAPRGR